ncbi:MAG: hypothetical protein EON98_12485, partial [Chitinophagaceae bacterium]
MRLLCLLLLFPFVGIGQNNFQAIGLWREHLPYQGAIDVTASDQKIYAATPFSLFSVDKNSKEIERFSKVSGLSETGVSAINYDPASKKLFVAYSNSNLDVNGFLKTATSFYAATEEGLKKTAVTATNPADFQAWQNLSGTNGLAASPAKAIVLLQNKILTLQNDSLFVENGANWTLFFANGWPVTSINVSNNQLLVTQRMANGASQVVIVDGNATVVRTLQQPGVISFPKKAIAVGTDYWIADLFGGLSQFSGNSLDVFKLNSPQDVVLGEMAVRNGTLWTTAGSVSSSWNYQYNRSGIFKLEDGNWSAFNQYNIPQLDTLLDFITIAIDPRDNTAWAGSFGGGLYHIDNSSSPKIFKQAS